MVLAQKSQCIANGSINPEGKVFLSLGSNGFHFYVIY